MPFTKQVEERCLTEAQEPEKRPETLFKTQETIGPESSNRENAVIFEEEESQEIEDVITYNRLEEAQTKN